MVLGDVYGCSFHKGYFLPYRWHIPRGGSNSLVLHNYCKVLQCFGIATSQSIAISTTKSQSITILIANFSSISKSIAKFSNIAKSIAKCFKYCK